MPDDFVRWNNKIVSAKSCSFTLAGVPFVGITALDYEEKLEKKIVHAANRSGAPLGTTAGKYEASASFTMLHDVFHKKFLPLMAGMSTALGFAPGSWGAAPPWPLIAQYKEGPIPPDVVTITGCEITGAKDTYQEGVDELVVEVSLVAMTIVRTTVFTGPVTLYDRTRDLL
jgi:hypothetical protein